MCLVKCSFQQYSYFNSANIVKNNRLLYDYSVKINIILVLVTTFLN